MPTDAKSAQEKAEEARREAAELTEVCYSHKTCSHCQQIKAAIDRYGLLARLAQAERTIEIIGHCKQHLLMVQPELEKERDRLRREAEEVESGE